MKDSPGTAVVVVEDVVVLVVEVLVVVVDVAVVLVESTSVVVVLDVVDVPFVEVVQAAAARANAASGTRSLLYTLAPFFEVGRCLT